jgi:membrane associated rhomboid family serine protease
MLPISDAQYKAGRFPLFNILIIGFTIYVFFLQITSSDQEAFIYQYALVPASVDWSNFATLFPFVTAMFLHGGFLHIFSNMLFLWVFGDNVEGSLPLFFYPLLYLGSGIVGAVTQYLLMPASTIPMLGASGAVAGALGGYFALFPHHRIKTLVFLPPFFITTAEINAGLMLGYWFILQLFSGALSLPFLGEQGGVAFFAHAGGFIFGYIFTKLLGRYNYY